MNTATLVTAIQYTPPNAPTNSGNATYTVAANYTGQSVGQLDIQPGVTPPVINSIPFGTVTNLLMLIIQNLQSTDVGVRINGGLNLVQAGTDPVITVTLGVVVISGLSGMTSQIVGGTLKIAGATNPGNNGTFTITAYNSATSVTISNPSAVTADTGTVWIANVTVDNFRVPTKGELIYACPAVPFLEPITSVSVVSIANPLQVEQINWWVFGN